ncbi:MAG TPA: hypothetical protein EYG73_00370 [Arcobacter sp.]|nr:hypothetical protein [Arcobacter sp.]
MKSILAFILFFSFSYASLDDLVTQQRAELQKNSKISTKNTCYEYVDIHNKKEWKASLSQLNTFIDKAQKKKCKKYIIYKIIKNVNVFEKGKLNIGSTIDKISGITLESHVTIEDSSIQSDKISLLTRHIDKDTSSDITHKVNIIDSEIKDNDDFSEDEDLNTNDFNKEDD